MPVDKLQNLGLFVLERGTLFPTVVHQDYAIQGSDIKVAIFDDMLEITSPGPLPDNLPPDALGNQEPNSGAHFQGTETDRSLGNRNPENEV